MAPISTQTIITPQSAVGQPPVAANSVHQRGDARDNVTAFHHIEWYVGNAKQAATYFVTRFGFERVAYRGLETGCRTRASHVVRQGDIHFILTSPINGPGSAQTEDEAEQQELRDMHEHIALHGDAVKDVAFTVDDAVGVYEAAIKNGARAHKAPYVLEDDKGKVICCDVKTYGDTVSGRTKSLLKKNVLLT